VHVLAMDGAAWMWSKVKAAIKECCKHVICNVLHLSCRICVRAHAGCRRRRLDAAQTAAATRHKLVPEAILQFPSHRRVENCQGKNPHFIELCLCLFLPAGFVSGHTLVVDGAAWTSRKPLLLPTYTMTTNYFTLGHNGPVQDSCRGTR